jgi:2,3-bisphosphoglycerate-independent phosphoglycerate mutase
MLIILDGILGSPESDSLIRKVEGFQRLGEVSALTRLSIPDCETPEAMLLGLAPEDGQLRQGPLTVSALGWDPPERSLHFHLSLLSLGDKIVSPNQELSSDEFKVIEGKLALLKTKKLTTLVGQQFDHGLVWERTAELKTVPPPDIDSLVTSLPEGDGEDELRRFIDDSVNLLHEEEFNLRRIDKGLDPVNLVWPWGHGFRLPVPNLALRYGFPYRYESSTMRLAGLVRLAGFRHGEIGRYKTGLQTQFHAIQYDPGTIVHLDPWKRMREKEEFEEAAYLASKCGEHLIARMLDHVLENRLELRVVLRGADVALATIFSATPVQNVYPLDERSLSEQKLPIQPLHEFVRTALS